MQAATTSEKTYLQKLMEKMRNPSPLNYDIGVDERRLMYDFVRKRPRILSTFREDEPVSKKPRVEQEDKNEKHSSTLSSPQKEIVYFFPAEGVLGNPAPWIASDNSSDAKYPLKSKMSKDNVVKVKLSNFSTCAFNITSRSDQFSSNIFFHCSLRARKQQSFIVMNDKYGTWGNEVKVQTDIDRNSVVLSIYLHSEGFAVFDDKKFVVFFPFRHVLLSDIEQSDLQLVFPLTDANGKKYKVEVDQVWQGPTKEGETLTELITPSIQQTIDAAIEQTSRKSVDSRTVIVRNVPKTADLLELQEFEFLVTEFLENDIGKEYLQTITMSLYPNTNFGYIRFVSPEIAERAVEVIRKISFEDNVKGTTITLTASLVRPGEIGHEETFANKQSL